MTSPGNSTLSETPNASPHRGPDDVREGAAGEPGPVGRFGLKARPKKRARER
jgi:hypothetical protein